jgi:ABC-2 type transport system permease protein
MSAVWLVFRREFAACALTPLNAVFVVLFLLLAGVLTFYAGDFYQRGQADLQPFFGAQPWLFLLLAPALSMRLWSKERRSGTLGLLLALPLRTTQAVAGKLLAVWAFAAIALVLTMPIWLIVNYLGRPDNGIIVAGYLGSLLLAGMFLAIGGCMSALTRSRTLAFVTTALLCLALMLADYPPLQEALRGGFGNGIGDVVAGLSVIDRFAAIARGVLVARDAAYFVLGIAVATCATVLAVNLRRTV